MLEYPLLVISVFAPSNAASVIPGDRIDSEVLACPKAVERAKRLVCNVRHVRPLRHAHMYVFEPRSGVYYLSRR